MSVLKIRGRYDKLPRRWKGRAPRLPDAEQRTGKGRCRRFDGDMKTLTGYRASGILYNWLASGKSRFTAVLPCCICETVPAVYKKLGLEIRWCDLERPSWKMDREAVRRIAREENGAFILHYSHTYGHRDGEEYAFLRQLRREFPDSVLIDDCCLCDPAFAPADEAADLTLFSTGYAKTADLGWGGYAFASDSSPYEEQAETYSEADEHRFEAHVKACRESGQRADEAILRSDWLRFQPVPDGQYFPRIREHFQRLEEHRAALDACYRELEAVSLPESYCRWRWNILVENREECVSRLFQEGLFCSTHYKSLCGGSFGSEETPVCRELQEHVINLFHDFYYTREQAEKTVRILRETAVPRKGGPGGPAAGGPENKRGNGTDV